MKHGLLISEAVFGVCLPELPFVLSVETEVARDTHFVSVSSLSVSTSGGAAVRGINLQNQRRGGMTQQPSLTHAAPLFSWQ